MAERRIGYAKDKSEIIGRLVGTDDHAGPFRLIADVLVFAAALGIRRNRRRAIASSSADPIRQEIFDRHGYDTMMNLLALHVESNTDILADSSEMLEKRAKIFEEYANGGLEILQEELVGSINPLETIVLLIGSERNESKKSELDGFDLTKVI